MENMAHPATHYFWVSKPSGNTLFVRDAKEPLRQFLPGCGGAKRIK